jgi:5-methylcytosine-specific restriction endonuclease McrA
MQKLALATIKRSDEWEKLKRQFKKMHPKCAVCGTTKQLEVHHIKPVHIFPELELELTNLLMLCEGDTNCHLMFGHLKNYKKYNSTVVADAILWNAKIKGE